MTGWKVELVRCRGWVIWSVCRTLRTLAHLSCEVLIPQAQIRQFYLSYLLSSLLFFFYFLEIKF
jgi:hypothetical protein